LTNLLYIKRQLKIKKIGSLPEIKALINFMGILFTITVDRWCPPGNAGLRTGFFKKRIIYDWNEKQPAGTETGVPGKKMKSVESGFKTEIMCSLCLRASVVKMVLFNDYLKSRSRVSKIRVSSVQNALRGCPKWALL